MAFQSPGDVIFTVFNYPVYYYGVIMAAACFLGVSASYLVFKKYNPEKNYDAIWDFSVWVLLAGIIGARLYYCLLNLEYYLHYPLQILNLRQGGLSIHGAVIFGILALIIVSKKYKLPLLNLLDSFACGTAIAQALGRWGNFFNSEAFGYPTNLPWKLYIAPSHRPAMYMDYSYFHPTFLYESMLDLGLFFILILLMPKLSKKYSGAIFCIYIILYSIIRLFVESYRIDSAMNILGIPIAKIMSCILIIVSCLIFMFAVNIKKD